MSDEIHMVPALYKPVNDFLEMCCANSTYMRHGSQQQDIYNTYKAFFKNIEEFRADNTQPKRYYIPNDIMIVRGFSAEEKRGDKAVNFIARVEFMLLNKALAIEPDAPSVSAPEENAYINSEMLLMRFLEYMRLYEEVKGRCNPYFKRILSKGPWVKTGKIEDAFFGWLVPMSFEISANNDYAVAFDSGNWLTSPED